MTTQEIGLLCIAGMLALIALRAPIALAMGLTGFVGFGLIVSFDAALSLLGSGPFQTLSTHGFTAIPMFILMGVLASKARMSSELFSGARTLFGAWPGGMALAAVTSCGAFSAISGSSLATAAAMSKVALPDMRRHGYAPSLAAGTLAAGGTLGIMIPPSIALLLYALITEQSAGDMFIAGLLPGLLGLLLYGLTIAALVTLKPHIARPGPPTPWVDKLRGLKGLMPFGGVFGLIIGGIYGGLFTPTEAAAVGVFGTFLIARARGLTWRQAGEALTETLLVSAMIFFMIVGADLFGTFLSVSRISFALTDYVASLDLTPLAVLACVLLLYVVLGCVMDSIAMLLLTVPVVYPVILAAGFDPVWFGVVTVITVEMGLITPPVGMNVFVLKTMAPDIPIQSIFKGVLPFVLSDVIRLALLVAVPGIALALL